MWLGEIDASQVLDYKFTTRNTSGVPTTLGGTPAVSVYKGNGTTESTTGVTLTADFDARTGLNHLRIDTSADGTFYAAGSDFQVVITTGTVGGSSVVGEVIGHFTIRNRAPLKPATAGRTIVIDASGLADATMVKAGPTGAATAITARDIGASVLLSSGTGTGQILLSSGTVTVGTNNDKTAYSLSQAFPANFSALTITVGGAVTAGTVSDKTGYSLSSSQTFNLTGNITGNLSGSVGSVTGAVGSVTAGVTLAANQHVIVDSGTITTVSGQLTAYSSGTGVFSVAALANAPAGGGGGGGASVSQILSALTAGYNPGTVGSALDLLNTSGATITVGSNYDPDTGVLTLVRGRDYKAAEGRALSWSSNAWPDLTGKTPTLLIYRAGRATISVNGTVSNPGPAPTVQTVSFDVGHATLAVPASSIQSPYVFEVIGTFGTDQVPLVGPGNCVIVQNAAP